MTNKLNQIKSGDENKNASDENKNEQSSKGVFRNRVKTGAKVAAIILAAGVAQNGLAEEIDLSRSMMANCDMNGDGKINTKQDWREGKATKKVVKLENRCEGNYETAQIDNKLAQGLAYSKELDNKLAQGLAKKEQLLAKKEQLLADGKELDKRLAQLVLERSNEKEGLALLARGVRKDLTKK